MINKGKKVANIILIINNIKVFLIFIKDLIIIDKDLDNCKINYK